MALDLGAELAQLRGAGAGEPLRAFERALAEKRVEFRYTVVSAASAVRTGLLVWDMGPAGAVLDSAETAAGLAGRLTAQGFSVGSLAASADFAALTDDELLRAIGKRDDMAFERLIHGSARITGTERSGESILVRVTGSVRVTLVATGETLASAAASRTGRGRDESSAASAAFFAVGATLGEELARTLP
jgi:hypothetical protein